MAINPNISLAVRGVELPDPLAQYGKFAAIQQAQQQNQLAQMQMQEAQAAMQERNALRQLDPNSPDYERQLFRINPKLGMEHRKEQASLRKTTAETAAAEAELQNKKLNWTWQALGSSPTPEQALANIDKGLKTGALSMSEASAHAAKLQNISPEDFAQYRKDMLLQTLGGLDQLNQSKLTTKDTDLGKYIQRETFDVQGRRIGAPERISKTPSFSDVTAQGNLSLAQQKFAFEQANPGITVQQMEDGTLVGVNNRTGVAMPITMGGAAPMAPAPAPVSNQFSPRIAPPVSPATAAMPAAPMAGTPLRGKGTALTESQGNAVAYGLRMKEANSILEPLEKAGRTNTGLISGAVGGTVGLIPFIGDKLEGVSGSVFNVLPQILGGLSPEQQKIAQARINFITAILRKESGAAIGANEFATAEKNYFPKPGDDAATIAQKQQARKTAIRAMKVQAGPGAKNIDEYTPTVSTSVITHPNFPGFSIGQ